MSSRFVLAILFVISFKFSSPFLRSLSGDSLKALNPFSKASFDFSKASPKPFFALSTPSPMPSFAVSPNPPVSPAKLSGIKFFAVFKKFYNDKCKEWSNDIKFFGFNLFL